MATALNLGYSVASGDIVIKSDADQLLDKNSLINIVRHFSKTEIGAVSGRQILLKETKQERGYRSLIDLKRLVENKLDSIYLLEPFSAFRKNLIEPIDPTSLSDESELALKIRRKGYRIIFDPEATFYEEIPSKFIPRLKLKQRRAQGYVQVMIKNLDMCLNRKYGYFGLLIYPLNFLMIIITPWLILSSFIWLPYLISIPELIPIMAMLGITIYLIGKPSFIAGFIEANLALVIAQIILLFKGPEYIWSRP